MLFCLFIHVRFVNLLAPPKLEPMFETPTNIESEFGQIIYIWATVKGRNVKLGICGSHVKLTVSVDALRYELRLSSLINSSSLLSLSDSTIANAMRENCLSSSTLISADVRKITQPDDMMYHDSLLLLCYRYYLFIMLL